MTIKDKQPTRPNHLALCVLNEVLQPLNSKFIGCSAVITDSISLILRYIILEPGGRVVLVGKDDEQQDSPASSVDSLDHYCPLLIATLDSLWPASTL
jgi:hypothetical protein